MSEPRNFVKVTSPVGKLLYPQSLQKPNTKFDPDGVWQASYVLPAEEGLAFKEQLQEIFEEQIIPAVKEHNKIRKKVKVSDLPIEEDEEGNIVFKLKMKTKMGKKKTKPTIVDSEGNPVTVSLASGSEGMIGLTLYGWFSPSLGIGLQLQPTAVSLTEIVEYQAGSGFDFAISQEALAAKAEEDDYDDEESEEEEDEEDDEDF